MTKLSFIVRRARLPEEAPQLKGFVMALQRYEHGFESNRRLDDRVADEYFDILMERVREHEGCIFVAEAQGRVIGWLLAVLKQDDIYVVEPERAYGYIEDLFVDEVARLMGVGTALVEAAEQAFAARGIKVIQIGVLTGNARAHAAYRAWGFSDYVITLRKRL